MLLRWSAVTVLRSPSSASGKLVSDPVTLVFHVAAYHQAVLQQKTMDALIQQIMFMKNISIMGGLLMVASFGPGGISLDGRGEAESLSGSLRAA